MKEKTSCGIPMYPDVRRETPGCEGSSGKALPPLVCCGIALAAIVALPLWTSCRADAEKGRVEEAAPVQSGPELGRSPSAAGDQHEDHWTCPMHPDVHRHAPGDCPICGMELVPQSAGSDAPGAKPAPGASAATTPPTPSHMDHHGASPEAGQSPETAPLQVVQTTCPVSGEDINPEVFTDYRGVRVFFCCPTCKRKFINEPDKYVSSLPEAVRRKIRTAP